MPYEEDKIRSDNLEDETQQNESESQPAEKNLGEKGIAPDAEISTPSADTIEGPSPDAKKREAAKKLEDLFIHTDDRLNRIEAQLEQIPKMVQDNVIAVLRQYQEETHKAEPEKNGGGNLASAVGNLSQEEKLVAFSEFGKSLSEVIRSWKGGGSGEGGGVDFKSMMADWGMRMFQYHLDNMAQSVYQIKLPPPDNVAARSAAAARPMPGSNFMQQTDPRHKFE